MRSATIRSQLKTLIFFLLHPSYSTRTFLWTAWLKGWKYACSVYLLFNSLSTAHASFKSRTYITPLENQLKQLHLEISNSLEQKHSIARCAKQLNISESYFQLIYKSCLAFPFSRIWFLCVWHERDSICLPAIFLSPRLLNFADITMKCTSIVNLRSWLG